MSRDGQRADDARWMRRALELARLGEGLTRPNPPVGAVLVRGGEVVGEGWHRKAGGPHAEVWALREAGEKAHGATLYVTLEPCTTTGRTPPCADAVIRAGVARVVVGTADPNPKHAGRAFPIFGEAGIEVECGVEEAAAKELLAPFAATMVLGRPHFTLKLGLTLDGFLADAAGRSQWITGEAAREKVQELRQAADAVMVGAGTLRADDPSLWPRPDGGREPWRVVVGGTGGLPAGAKVFTDEHRARTIVALKGRGWADAAAVRAAGATVLELPEDEGGFWAALCRELRSRDVMGVLCEGGGGLAGSLLKAGLVDRVQIFRAPKFLGRGISAAWGAAWALGGGKKTGNEDVAPPGRAEARPSQAAPEFVATRVERVGDDIWTTYERKDGGAG